MYSTLIKINKMDCPSEEQLIRMNLSEVVGINKLMFNLNERTLTIIHTAPLNDFYNKISNLKLDDVLIKTELYSGEIKNEDNVNQKSLLWKVLIINLTFFIVEVMYGIISNSMGLVADGLDMLADSFVYSISLIAITSNLNGKKNVALISAFLQFSLAIIGIYEVMKRFFNSNDLPDYQSMLIVSFFALFANSLCLYILQKSRSNEAHMKASMIFTSNDVIANIGVILASIIVYLTNSRIPDLVIGSIIFLIVARGAKQIYSLSK